LRSAHRHGIRRLQNGFKISCARITPGLRLLYRKPNGPSSNTSHSTKKKFKNSPVNPLEAAATILQFAHTQSRTARSFYLVKVGGRIRRANRKANTNDQYQKEPPALLVIRWDSRKESCTESPTVPPKHTVRSSVFALCKLINMLSARFFTSHCPKFNLSTSHHLDLISIKSTPLTIHPTVIDFRTIVPFPCALHVDLPEKD